MKSSVKFLSIILILASLLGLIGGGIGLKDVMDCKAYWEDKGAKSAEDLTTLEDGLNTLKENEQAYYDGLKAYETGLKAYEQGLQELTAGQSEFNAGQMTLEQKQQQYNQGLADLKAAEQKLAAARKTLEDNMDAYMAGKAQLAQYTDQQIADIKAAYDGVMAAKAQGLSDDAAIQYVANATVTAQVTEAVRAAYAQQLDALVRQEIRNSVIDSYAYLLDSKPDKPTDDDRKVIESILNSSYPDEYNAKYNQAIAANYDTVLNQYMTASQPQIQQSINEQVAQRLPGAIVSVRSAYEGYPTLRDGIAKIQAYEKGLAEYNAGLDSYYAGRNQLVNGKVQLDEGQATLEEADKTITEGLKTLEAAEKELAEGKAKLDEFESGRDQVIDGIGTVLASETYGSLKSIADRLGPEYKYVDDKGNLDIEQGLAAVATAREFSAENSAVITRELTTRAVAAVIALVASVLGILAGIVGIIGKVKLSGILSAVAAVCGVIAIAVAVAAGSVMSVAAGSSVAAITIAAGAFVAIVGIVNVVSDFKGTKAAA